MEGMTMDLAWLLLALVVVFVVGGCWAERGRKRDYQRGATRWKD